MISLNLKFELRDNRVRVKTRLNRTVSLAGLAVTMERGTGVHRAFASEVYFKKGDSYSAVLHDFCSYYCISVPRDALSVNV